MRTPVFGLILLILVVSGPPGAYPAAAGGMAASDSVGPAFDISGNVTLGPAMEYQIESSVAFDGTNFLVVWSDYRSLTSYDIFGARVGVDGSVVDDGGFVISSAAGYQETPAVAFDGTNYLVVWADMRDGTGDIYASRVDPAGNVLDPGGIAVCSEAGAQAEVAISFADSQYLVVWTDTRDANENIYCARVDPDGAVLDPGGTAVCTDPATQRYPAVSANGAGWLVVWQDRRNSQNDIYGSRVSAEGVVLDGGSLALATEAAEETYPAVGFNNKDCLVVWDIDQGATSHDVRGTRVDTSGVVLDPSGIDICDHAAYQGYAAVGTDGHNFMVIWDDFRSSFTWDVYGARVDPGGSVLDTTSLAICLEPSQQSGLALAFCGTRWLITWHDSRNDHKDIFGIRVAVDGKVLDAASFLISNASISQSQPAVAFDGADYLVVRHEWRQNTLYDIRATRVTPAGAVLDPGGISICALPSDAMYPAVCFDGSNYLVAWQDYRNGQWDIYAARVAPDGSVLDAAGFPVSTASGKQERPAIAYDGLRYLVLWQDSRNSGYDIYGTRVSTGGSVLEPWGIMVSDARADQTRPAAASDGSAFFAVWEDGRNVYDDIYAARISAAGSVLDSAGIAVCNASLAQENADVAFDGERYAVVWQDKRSNVDYDIRLARVGAGGAVLDPSGVVVCSATGNQEAPAVTSNGRGYVLMWQDARDPAGRDIYGARVDTSGAVSDPGGFVVSDAAWNQATPDLCATPAGVILMVYSSFIADPGYGSYRIWANFFDLVAGAPASTPAEGGAFLYPGYPNPFTARTTIRFRLARRAQVNLGVYDVEGRLVATLFDGAAEAGMHCVGWAPGSAGGRAPAPGVYFLRLKAGDSRQVGKVLLVK
jgi:hypothetical protein